MIYVQDRKGKTIGILEHAYSKMYKQVLSQGLSSFEFTIAKVEQFQAYVTMGNHIVMKSDDGVPHQFTIMTVDETHDEKVVYCEDIGLTLINKTAGAWEAPTIGKTYADYIMQAVGNTGWVIGINESGSDLKIYSWDQSTTALERILDISAMAKMEISFSVEFTNLTVTKKKIDIYKKRGSVRNDIQLVYDGNVSGIKRKGDIMNLVTAYRGVGSAIEAKGYDVQKEDPNKISIVYKEGYGVNAVDSTGKVITGTNKRFLTSSTWDIIGYQWCGSVFGIKVSSTEYIPIEYTNMHTIRVNYVKNYGVHGWDASGNIIEGSNKKFKSGTGWKVSSIVDIKGSRTYKLSTTEYMPIMYTQFGEGRTSKAHWTFEDLVYQDDDYFTEAGSDILYAKKANEQFNYDDEYILKDFSYDTASAQVLLDKTLEQLKIDSKPKLKYDVTLSEVPKSLHMGDEIRIIDQGYQPPLYLTARVSELDLSDTRSKNKAVFTNFVEKKSSITQTLRSMQKQLEEQSKLVNNFVWVRYADDDQGNGISAFPKGKLYMAIVYSNISATPSENPDDYAGKWILVKGQDGSNGIEGPKGEDGRTSYFHTAWANDVSGTTGFTTSGGDGKKYIGTYSDLTKADSEDPSKYNWALFKGKDGQDGQDGQPGKDGTGIKSTVVRYQASSSGTTHPTGIWTSTVPAVTKGQYLWTRTDWTYTDNSTETGYSVSYIAKDGNNGTNGVAGKDGVGIKTTTITYASSSSGTVAPTSGWTANPPATSAGHYIWTKTVWTYTDGTSETGYSVGKIGEKGDQGIKGPKGLDGKSSYTHIAYATSSAGSGFSQTPTATTTYVGMYVDSTATDSTDPSKYKWTLIKGADGGQGTPGKAGTDGKTPYLHTAYSWSADGTDRFMTVYPNENLWSDKKIVPSYIAAGDGLPRKSLIPDAAILDPVTVPSTATKLVLTIYNPNKLVNTVNTSKPSFFKGDTYLGYQSGFQLTGDMIQKEEWSIPAGATKAYLGTLLGADNAESFDFSIKTKYEFDTATPYTPSPLDDPEGAYPKFIGTYTDYTAADSTSPSKYTWAKLRGEQGLKGDSGADGKPGKDGVGLKSTTVTYQASTSGTTRPSGTWSTGVPTLSKGKYLWTRTVWTYTDKTSETGYSVSYIAKDGNTGANGIAGKDGVGIKSTTIAYQSGTSGTVQPTGTWVANPPSVTGGNYLWTRTIWSYTDGTSESGYSVAKMGEKGDQGIKGPKGDPGNQGIPGTPGTDGKTPYFHQAWADSQDGKTNFSKIVSLGKKYLGTYTDYVADDSADPAKYKWTELVGAIEVGGRNYIKNSDQTITINGDTQHYISIYRSLTNEYWTFSAEVKYTRGTDTSVFMIVYSDDTKTGYNGESVPIVNGKIAWSFKPSNPAGVQLLMYASSGAWETTPGKTLEISHRKLEKGNKATDWSPAPEDVQAYTDQKAAETLAKAKDEINLVPKITSGTYFPAGPKNGDQHWKTNSTGDVIGLYKFNGSNWVASNIDAKALNVTSLSALTANLGTINAGTLNGVKLDAPDIVSEFKGVPIASMPGHGVFTVTGDIRLKDGRIELQGQIDGVNQKFYSGITYEGIDSYMTADDGSTQMHSASLMYGELALDDLISGSGNSAKYLSTGINAESLYLNFTSSINWLSQWSNFAGTPTIFRFGSMVAISGYIQTSGANVDIMRVPDWAKPAATSYGTGTSFNATSQSTDSMSVSFIIRTNGVVSVNRPSMPKGHATIVLVYKGARLI